MAKSAEVVTPDTLGPAGAALVRAMEGGEIAVFEDPAEVAARMAAQTLVAGSIDDVLSESGTTSGGDILGVPLEIRSFVMRESQVDGANVYIVIDAIDLNTGEMLAITSSSPKVMAQCARVQDLDGLPLSGVEFYEMSKAKPGQSAPLGLRKAA